MIGLGCMRLSTEVARDDANAIAVIHAALDAGATFLDTADAYCLNDEETGHNERLIAAALRAWQGDRSRITIGTKGGLRRPGGKWLPDARASQLKAACDASRRALDVDVIDLYQLHAVDPRTPLETSVRALAALQRDGVIRRIGLCNVNVAQISAARAIADIASVQVSMSVFDDESMRNGVAEYCAQRGIMLLAYRPLGGERAARMAKDAALAAVAERHAVTPQEAALAWLRDLAPHIVPVPGPTTVAHARSLARVLDVRLDEGDRVHLDVRYPAGRMLREPRTLRQPPAQAAGDVVLIMGMPGAGKTSLARDYAARGYVRLNRDDSGGTLSALAAQLERELADGHRQCVLDNTYATRAARSRVIESAWQHGVPVRCVWLKTSLADAQVNAVQRLLDAHGRLPTPEDLRTRGRSDHRYFGPDAQFRYERQLEPPTTEEGFSDVEVRAFARTPVQSMKRAVVLEYDEVLVEAASGNMPGDRINVLRRYHAEGWSLAAIAWRPNGDGDVAASFERTRAQLEVPIALGFCPHPGGPPVCWCRKPLPGLVLELLHHDDIDLSRSVMVGRAPADRTLADKLGMHYTDAETFFSRG